MKLLEKLKNTFFEEEEYVVDEPVKEEKISKRVETKAPVVEKEPEVEELSVKDDVEELVNVMSEDEEDDISFSDSNLVSKNNKLPYYNDEDFVETKYDLKPIKEDYEPKKVYGGSEEQLYQSINIDKESVNPYGYGDRTKKRFRPTPIISPIYGVLDKNYSKDEIIDKKDKPSSFVSAKDMDFDSVRKKAYGSLEKDEEEEESKEEIKNIDDEKDALLYDMMVDDTKPVVDSVTMADAEEYFNDLGLEYNVDYKDANYQSATGRRIKSSTEIDDEEDDDEVVEKKPRRVRINNNNLPGDEEKEEEIELPQDIDVEDDDAGLEDNLFDLVDSMYEGGEE